MADTAWWARGEFLGNCSCDYLRCPCPQSNYTEAPSRGWCAICITFHFASGMFGETKLDDLNVAVIIHCPSAMADGGWSIGLIVDSRADEAQTQALVGIMSGQAGGPMTMAAAWVKDFRGLERRPITVERDGNARRVSVDGLVDCRMEATSGADRDQPVYLDNLWHPAAARMALARGTDTHIHAFGVDYDGSGNNFAGYTAFDWASD
jgi:hypothetical protein